MISSPAHDTNRKMVGSGTTSADKTKPQLTVTIMVARQVPLSRTRCLGNRVGIYEARHTRNVERFQVDIVNAAPENGRADA